MAVCMQKKTVDLIFVNRPKRTNEFHHSTAGATVRHSEWHSEHLSPCGSTVRFDSHGRGLKEGGMRRYDGEGGLGSQSHQMGSTTCAMRPHTCNAREVVGTAKSG